MNSVYFSFSKSAKLTFEFWNISTNIKWQGPKEFFHLGEIACELQEQMWNLNSMYPSINNPFRYANILLNTQYPIWNFLHKFPKFAQLSPWFSRTGLINDLIRSSSFTKFKWVCNTIKEFGLDWLAVYRMRIFAFQWRIFHSVIVFAAGIISNIICIENSYTKTEWHYQ